MGMHISIRVLHSQNWEMSMKPFRNLTGQSNRIRKMHRHFTRKDSCSQNSVTILMQLNHTIKVSGSNLRMPRHSMIKVLPWQSSESPKWQLMHLNTRLPSPQITSTPITTWDFHSFSWGDMKMPYMPMIRPLRLIRQIPSFSISAVPLICRPDIMPNRCWISQAYSDRYRRIPAHGLIKVWLLSIFHDIRKQWWHLTRHSSKTRRLPKAGSRKELPSADWEWQMKPSRHSRKDL